MTRPIVPSPLALAQARAQAARARLSGTIAELQERAKPTSLVHDMAETIKERGTGLALGLVDTAKRKPAHVGAVVTLVGLFLARRRVGDLIRRATGATPPKRGPVL